jgi:hypothetical protein
VSYVALLENGRLVAAWHGHDSGIGISHYNIDYRPYGDPNWVRWLTNYPANASHFEPPDGRDYWFRSQAIDALGNVEPWSDQVDAGTGDAIPVYRAIMFPLFDFGH